MNWLKLGATVLVLWSTTVWGASMMWDANNASDVAGYRVYQCRQLPCSKAYGTLLATLGKVTNAGSESPNRLLFTSY